jgi:two-component system chemotaxis response regulator CheY
MRILVAEDDFISRRLIKDILIPYGECDIVVDGEEAVKAFQLAWDEKKPYDLVCLDIMMPNVNGQEALRRIRVVEKEKGVQGPKEAKVIMITVLDDPKTVVEALHKGGATSYIVKPISKGKLLDELRSLGLIR